MYVFEICVFLDYIRPGVFKNPSYTSISPTILDDPLELEENPPHQKSFLLPLILSGCPQEAYNLHY